VNHFARTRLSPTAPEEYPLRSASVKQPASKGSSKRFWYRRPNWLSCAKVGFIHQSGFAAAQQFGVDLRESSTCSMELVIVLDPP